MLQTVLSPFSSNLSPDSTTSALLHQSRDRHLRDAIQVSMVPDLRTLFQDTAYTSDLVNVASLATEDTQRINLHDFLHTLLSLGYRLVQLRPLGASCWVVDTLGAHATSRDGPHSPETRSAADEIVLGEMVHLGLYAWLLRFMHRLDGIVEDVPRLNELAQRCADFVLGPISTDTTTTDEDDCFREQAGQIYPEKDIHAELLLWLLFLVASLGFQRRPYHSWLVVRVRQVLERLGLCGQQDGWELTRTVLRRFTWVDNLHGRCTQELWRDALGI